MKLKFINCLLTAAVLFGSAQVMTSCKDYAEDNQLRIEAEYQKLADRVKANEEAILKLGQDMEKIKQCYCEVKTKADVLKVIGEYFAGKNYSTDMETAIKQIIAQYLKDHPQGDGTGYTQAEIENIIKNYLANNPVGTGGLTEEQVNNLIKEYVDNASEAVKLGAMLEDLNNALTVIKKGEISNFAEYFTYLETTLSNLQAFVTEWEPQLPNIQQNALNAWNLANSNLIRIEALEKIVSDLRQLPGEVNALSQRVRDLEYELPKVKEKAEEAYQLAQDNLKKANDYTDQCINSLKGGYDGTLKDLNDAINTLDDNLRIEIGKNTTAINTLSEDLVKLASRVLKLEILTQALADRISSIELEATWSPVLGYLNTPFDASMNALVGVFGKSQFDQVTFPSTSRMNTYNAQAPVITAQDIAMLKACGVSPETITSDKFLTWSNDGTIDLGKIYMSINPANIDLSDKEFALVNSQNQNSNVKLDVKPSYKVLDFGYSRAETSANGFYEAYASVPAAESAPLHVSIDPSLKKEVASILKDPKAINRNTIFELAKATYHQVNGIVPALGVQAKWQEALGDGTTQTQMVHSKYGIGIGVYRPLSYSFAEGVTIDRRIPSIPDLSEKLGALNFEQFKPVFKFNDININLNTDNISFKLNSPVEITITDDLLDVTIPSINIYDADDDTHIIGVTEPQTVKVDNLSKLVEEINSEMNEYIQGKLSADVEKAYKDAINDLAEQIKGQIQKVVNDMSADINQGIDQCFNDIQNYINGKIESLSDRISGVTNRLNNLITRVNNVLSNPNHYLQPALVYKTSNTFGLMSNTKALPSQFNLKGGNAVTLIATSYTGEVVAPAYKKIVAVTNVYKDGKDAQSGDAACTNILKSINGKSGSWMCQIMYGARQSVVLDLSQAKGCTLEILYAAIDFQGYASSQKFYVTVK